MVKNDMFKHCALEENFKKDRSKRSQANGLFSKSLLQYVNYCFMTQDTKFYQKIRTFRVVRLRYELGLGLGLGYGLGLMSHLPYSRSL